MDRDVKDCDVANVSSDEYKIAGNQSLVKMVPAPDVVGHACAVYAPVESYLVQFNSIQFNSIQYFIRHVSKT